MTIRKYLGSFKRFIVICLILARQLLINLPYRLIFVPRPKSRKAIGKYLKTRRPKISAPEHILRVHHRRADRIRGERKQ